MRFFAEFLYRKERFSRFPPRLQPPAFLFPNSISPEVQENWDPTIYPHPLSLLLLSSLFSSLYFTLTLTLDHHSNFTPMSRLANTETNSFEEEKGTTQHNEIARPKSANDYDNDPALQVTPEFSKKTM